MGTSQAKLTVLPTRTVFLTGKPQANISDHLSMVNLAPFGNCRSMAFPATASATAAAQGTLTPMPCMHNTPFPWMMGKNDYIVKGDPALLKSSTCQCMWGGTISITDDGQGTGSPDMSRKPQEKFSKDQQNEKKSSYAQPKSSLGKFAEGKNNQFNGFGDDLSNVGNKLSTSTYITETTNKVVKAITEDIPMKMGETVLANNWKNYSDEEKKRILTMAGEMPGKLSMKERLKKAENCLVLEKGLGITKGRPMTTENADKQNANPQYTYQYFADPNGPIVVNGIRVRSNPNYKPQYSINCATCSATYALRLMGFDVKAKGNVAGTLNNEVSHHPFDMWNNPDGTKAEPIKTDKWMKDNNIEKMSIDDYKSFFEENCAEEGVYTVALRWNGGGGHATILQRDKDGQLYYIEPQVFDSNKTQDGRRSIDDLLISANGGLNLSSKPSGEEGVLRVDNKLLNPSYVSLFDT